MKARQASQKSESQRGENAMSRRSTTPPWGGVSDWGKLKAVAAQGYSDGILCLASIEIIERSNRPSVIDPLNEHEAGRAARLFIDAALFRLQMFITRAYAPVRHTGDLHLRAAIGFLEQPGRLMEETRLENRNELADAIRLFTKASRDPRLTLLKHMRDKMLAHWAEPDARLRLPMYHELFDFTKETCAIWERLSFGAGTVMIELDDQIDAYRESAEAFWSRWEG